MNNYIIYKVTNKINNKVYFGSTAFGIERRWKEHKSAAKNNKGYRFHKAIKKHGEENFKIEVVLSILKEEHLDDMEQYFITLYDSCNFKKGYNSIGVTKGNRQLVQKTMQEEWKNPEQRKIRLDGMRKGSKHRFKAIVSVCVNSGKITFFENVHDAMRTGISTYGIYECLSKRDKKGMGYCWFYNTTNDEDFYKNEALKLLGKFKTEFTLPIISINLSTKEKREFKDIYEARDYLGIKPKTINRVLKGLRKSAQGFTFEFKK